MRLPSLPSPFSWPRQALYGALWCAMIWLLTPLAQAQGTVLKLSTRAGVETTVFWQPAPQARATVLLFPGGLGGFGKVEQGQPRSDNFLVRSAPDFVAQGLNVAIFGRANGQELSPRERMSPEHMEDVRQVIAAVQQRSSAPLWLVGTSRGTTSVATAASQLPDGVLAGVVLSSSIVDAKEPGALQSLNLSNIRVPVLLLHHAKDACRICPPSALPGVLQSLSQAPVKKLLLVDGGANPQGDPCHALHWHGYIGMEASAVADIAQWMQQPKP
jgi:pimeloyl-ACP methyl ester carboxylesterase